MDYKTAIIWAMARENLSSGFPTKSDSNRPAQLHRLVKSFEILDLASTGTKLYRKQQQRYSSDCMDG